MYHRLDPPAGKRRRLAQAVKGLCPRGQHGRRREVIHARPSAGQVYLRRQFPVQPCGLGPPHDPAQRRAEIHTVEICQARHT